MKGGILEVLIVSAKGIKHTRFIPNRAFYVTFECGTQVCKTKISKAKHKNIYWNEKFTMDFTDSEWENLTHLKFKIMDQEFLKDGGFVGETTIYIEGIKMEGHEKEFIEIKPTPYNVVLEDGNYKGEMKIGLKFITNKNVEKEKGECLEEVKKKEKSIFGVIMKNICEIPWLKSLFFTRNNTHKQN